jgi:hypothetical protein
VLTNSRSSVVAISIRFSIALAAAFLVTVVAPSIPVRLLRYDWQYGFADTIRTGTPLAILSVAFLLLALSLNYQTVASGRYFKIVRRICGWIAIGYFLQIPWQAAAGYFELQRLDFKDRSELLAASDVLNRVAQADTPERLKAVIASVPALAQQLTAQPNALENFSQGRANLLRNGRANLDKFKIAINQKIASAYKRFWLLLIQNALILGAYGWAFSALGSELGKGRLSRSGQKSLNDLP